MSTGRTYAGESAADRAEQRRRRLLDAGLQVLGTEGYRAATVRRICRAARVADRYFYECFDGTEDLLLAVHAQCVDRLRAAVSAALAVPAGGRRPADPLGLARTGLDAFLAVVEDDPRLARVVWFEVLGVSERVERTSLRTKSDFGRLLAALAAEHTGTALDVDDDGLTADALIGGISHVVMTWTARGFTPPRARVADALARFLVGGAGAAHRPGDAGHPQMGNQPSSD
ncbi:TetR family transcriptional regulator [Pseudonocardia kongjuensis]|uniref:TetR family transcriptional regulator n=1 Tax=Pseudonocardia kongjuensis TaxID=102227 RepID=A0ABP4IL81_9PSEU